MTEIEAASGRTRPARRVAVTSAPREPGSYAYKVCNWHAARMVAAALGGGS